VKTRAWHAASPRRCEVRAWRSGSIKANCASATRGGAKIRKQIRECARFAAVISRNTPARLEGYFRLEGRLADQRTRRSEKGPPLLVPIVIDGTADGAEQLAHE